MHYTIVSVADIPKDVVDCPTEDLKAIYRNCLEMQLLCLEENGVGLAAVQVGIPWRLFVARDGDKFRYFVNCEYVPVGNDKQLSVEGCLSIRNSDKKLRRFRVDRYKKIQFKGKELLAKDNLQLVDINEVYEGEIAIVLQHEQDHERWITIDKIGKEIYLFDS